MDLNSIIQYTHDLSILYIEDDLDSREHTKSILESLFSVVDTADDGKLGIDAYNDYFSKYNKYYDLILSDIELPHLSGIQLSKKILNLNPNQHIIIISAYNDKEKLQELLTIGVDNFIIKPIDFSIFFETLKKCSKPIVEQKNVKKRLTTVQEINYNLEAIMDIMNQVALVSKTDLKGNITYVNDIFCKSSKYTKEELIGGNHNILRHRDMPAIVYEHMWSDIQNGKMWKGKLKNKAKDTEPYYVNANIFPIFDKEDSIKEYIAISFITTEEEVKNREFKKKVIEQYQESKRNDFNSRRKINELEAKLLKYENIDLLEFNLKKMKKKNLDCISQLKFTEDTNKDLELEFDKYKKNIKKNISTIIDKNKKLTLKNELDIKRIADLEGEIKARKDEFDRMNKNNRLRAKEMEDLRDVIAHLEEKLKS